MITSFTSFNKLTNFTSINIFTCWSGLQPDFVERVFVKKDWDWSPMPMEVVRMSIVFTPGPLTAAAARIILPPPILQRLISGEHSKNNISDLICMSDGLTDTHTRPTPPLLSPQTQPHSHRHQRIPAKLGRRQISPAIPTPILNNLTYPRLEDD